MGLAKGLAMGLAMGPAMGLGLPNWAGLTKKGRPEPRCSGAGHRDIQGRQGRLTK